MGKGCSARTGTVCKGKALECKSRMCSCVGPSVATGRPRTTADSLGRGRPISVIVCDVRVRAMLGPAHRFVNCDVHTAITCDAHTKLCFYICHPHTIFVPSALSFSDPSPFHIPPPPRSSLPLSQLLDAAAFLERQHNHQRQIILRRSGAPPEPSFRRSTYILVDSFA